MNRTVGVLDVLLALFLALLLWAGIECAPEAYRTRLAEPEDWVGILLWSALILPACASAAIAGVVLLRGGPTTRVTLRAASWWSIGSATLAGALWLASIAVGEPELRMALVIPTGLFGASAWLLRRMDRPGIAR